MMTPEIEFLGQPFADSGSAGQFLRANLVDPEVPRLTIVVAWARYSGLGRLRPELEAFLARGGELRAIVGVDAGGATAAGLRFVASISTEAYVYHHPGGGTFHPKLYLAEGPSRASLLVGSSNATAGGLFGNYEASLAIRFALPREEQAVALVSAREYIRRLLQETAVCLPLTNRLAEQLIADKRHQVSGSERGKAGGRAPSLGHQESGGGSTFGSPDAAMNGYPALSAEAAKELAVLESPSTTTSANPPGHGATGTGSTPSPPAVVTRRWFKRALKPSDAQQLSSSSPSASLTLVAGGHPINGQTYFRDAFFGDLNWTGDHGREVALVTAEVWVAGSPLGRKRMEVVYDPKFEAGENNRTTLLRWGQLQRYMLKNSQVGRIVTLERLADGGFRVTIARDATGPFLR